jgi:hypothetical protein
MEGLMTTQTDLYEEDFIGWTEQQARALREAARRPTNLGLDWEHLAEEIEDLGRSYRRALASHVGLVIEHLLKLEFSPATEPRRGWVETLDRARDEIDTWLSSEPGLRPRLPEIIVDARQSAVRRAARTLLTFHEDTAAADVRLHGGAYTDEQITGDWYPDQAG